MNTVCDFLSFEMDSSSLGSPGGRLIEVSTREVYQGCPREGSGFGRGRSPAMMECQEKREEWPCGQFYRRMTLQNCPELREPGISIPVLIRNAV